MPENILIACRAERKQDTRRKILAGAMVLDRVARGELPEKLFKADMDRFLERDQEPSRRDGTGERPVLQRGA